MWIRFVRFKFRHELRGQSTDRACVKARGVTQQEAAKLLGTTQAQVSALMRCKPVSVSVGRLIEFLTMLGQDVKVMVKPAPRRRKAGDMSVVVHHV